MVQVVTKSSQQENAKTSKTETLLKKMRRISEEEKASRLASRLNLPYVDLNLMPINFDEALTLPEDVARRYSIGLFLRRGRNIRIASTDPESEHMRLFLRHLQEKKGWNIRLFAVSQSSLEKIWLAYKKISLLQNVDQMRMDLSGSDLESFEQKFSDILKLKERIKELPITEVISLIFAGAIKLDASDIHFEPEEKSVRLRYRIDGVLQDIGDFPDTIYRSILSRIKVLGKMKLNVRQSAQDGHFSISLEKIKGGNGKVDVRVSIIPSRHGESIVMRLLNQADVMIGVEELGLRGLALEEFQKQISKPNGMIVTTGPTGSGKTTTLYATLNRLNEPGVKIITIEDPIEYEIKGISQTQVASKAGYTFASGLRSIVRQDPDVILVGEIRDDETADIAINASLTGHLVLSTLHTNDAASSVPRLIELGVKPALIPPAVNVMIAQRLVRKLCVHCKKEYEPAEETREVFKRVLSIISPKAKVGIPKEISSLYKSVGCQKCNNTGYKGRIGIFEVLTINTEIQSMIEEMRSIDEITKAALENGMITMAQDGILKAVEGITSMEEVWRVAGQVDFLEEIYDRLMEQTLGRHLRISQKYTQKVHRDGMTKETFFQLVSVTTQEDLVETVLSGAVLFRAGDIHIEPTEKEVNIRFRIDGILQEVGKLPLSEYPSFLGKIKVLSGMKSDIRSGAADSRFSIIFEDPEGKKSEEKIDIRVSIILSGFGETAVLRLLNQAAVALDVESLGIRKQNLEKILTEIKKPNGIFFNTGPTGSGKTTTLYSLLKILNTSEVKIMTVEDPIEYQMGGILQTQVNGEEEYSFATALRSLLRQNPDVIMIGEIRDEETAGIAVQSSLTGHLVLSTLHTNDATSSIQRLLNMEIRPDDLATSANAFMAQRLVRKLCSCKKERKPNEKELEVFQKVSGTIHPNVGVPVPEVDVIYDAVGCDTCNGIGYIGRTVISEVLVMDPDIEALINDHALVSTIVKKAQENGMLTMAQDGILKIMEGETTLEEVERVVEI